MQLQLIYLILGLLGLWIGSELVVKGTLNIAKHYKISHLFLGLVILAIGTDLPELVVTVTAAVYKLGGVDTSGLVVGNSIGSCFSQVGFVLGIISLFGLMTLSKREIKRDGMMMIASVVLIIFAGYDGIITRAEGLIFILVYVLYVLAIYREEHLYEKIKRAPSAKWFWDAFSILGGFIIIYFGSGAVVDNGIYLAEYWGISQTIIGITLIGLGTSLPELFVSINALFKGATKLSATNLIGSNIFDALFTLGIGSAIAEFLVDKSLLMFDIPLLLLFSILVVYFFHRNMKIEKKEAIILLVIYFGYIGIKVFTNI